VDTIVAEEGDTWQSLAEAQRTPLTSLLAANGLSADACNEPPEPGTTIAIPPAPPPLAVAPGEDHQVDLPEQASLWVRLDMSPGEASDTRDALRLCSDDGSHDVTLRIAEHFTENGDYVDVMFDSVDPSLSYSIDYLVDGGEGVTIVQSVPYSELNDDSLADAEPAESFDDSDAGAVALADREVPPIVLEDLAPDVVAAITGTGSPDEYA
jgi:hypothetical protein